MTTPNEVVSLLEQILAEIKEIRWQIKHKPKKGDDEG